MSSGSELRLLRRGYARLNDAAFTSACFGKSDEGKGIYIDNNVASIIISGLSVILWRSCDTLYHTNTDCCCCGDAAQLLFCWRRGDCDASSLIWFASELRAACFDCLRSEGEGSPQEMPFDTIGLPDMAIETAFGDIRSDLGGNKGGRRNTKDDSGNREWEPRCLRERRGNLVSSFRRRCPNNHIPSRVFLPDGRFQQAR